MRFLAAGSDADDAGRRVLLNEITHPRGRLEEAPPNKEGAIRRQSEISRVLMDCE